MFKAFKMSGIMSLIKDIGICVEGLSKKEVSIGIIVLEILLLSSLEMQRTIFFLELGDRFQSLFISLLLLLVYKNNLFLYLPNSFIQM